MMVSKGNQEENRHLSFVLSFIWSLLENRFVEKVNEGKEEEERPICPLQLLESPAAGSRS